MKTPSRSHTFKIKIAALLSLFPLAGCDKPAEKVVPQTPPQAPAQVVPVKQSPIAGTYFRHWSNTAYNTLTLTPDWKWTLIKEGRTAAGGRYEMHPTRTDEVLMHNDDDPQAKPQHYLLKGRDLSTDLVPGQANWPIFIRQ